MGESKDLFWRALCGDLRQSLRARPKTLEVFEKPSLFTRLAETGDLEFAQALLLRISAARSSGDAGFWSSTEICEAALSGAVRCHELYIVQDAHHRRLGLYRLAESDVEYWPDHDDGSALYLHKLAVEPAWRGKGFARFVVEQSKGQARILKRRFLRLDYRRDREKLGVLYRGLGFVPHSVVEVHGGTDSVRMQMRVDD